jgi:hypothetical protein
VVAATPGHPAEDYLTQVDPHPAIAKRLLLQISEDRPQSDLKLIKSDRGGNIHLTESGLHALEKLTKV